MHLSKVYIYSLMFYVVVLSGIHVNRLFAVPTRIYHQLALRVASRSDAPINRRWKLHKVTIFGFQPKNMLKILYLPQHIVLKLFESNGTLSHIAASREACHRPIVLAPNGCGSWWIYTYTIFSVLNTYGYLKNPSPCGSYVSSWKLITKQPSCCKSSNF